MATHSTNKNFTKPGCLDFPQCGRRVKIAIVRTSGGPIATPINFFHINNSNKLGIETSK